MKKSSTDCEGGQRAIAAYNWRYFDAATPKQTEELAAQQARATPKSCSCQASVLQPASEATNPFFSDEDAPDDAADDTNHP